MLNNPYVTQRGINLIELAIVIAIIAITLSYGLPGFSEWVQNSKIRTSAESIASGLQTARAEAVRRNARVEFVLSSAAGTAGATGWTVRLANSGTTIQSRPDQESSSGVVFTATPAGATTVTFEGTGRFPSAMTTNFDGSAFLTQVDIDSTAISASVSRELRIVISSGGQIRMCDPNVTASDDPRKC